ncbi:MULTISPECIES: hypothetical protein [unclassified Streptomyces]|nr:hypothetical protein [Streptomyces sp. NRRL F-5135]
MAAGPPDEAREQTGAAELTLAVGATAAASAGTVLVARRYRRRAPLDHH